MNRKPKAKQKRALPLSLDFVTALTPDECRDMLLLDADRYTGDGTLNTEFGDEGQFWVERTGNFHRFNPSPLRFAGTLTEVAVGTRVKGEITPDTLDRLQQMRRKGWRRFFAVRGALVSILILIAVIIDPDSSSLAWNVFLYLSYFVILAIAYHVAPRPVNLEHSAAQIVGWLHKYLYFPPELHPLEGDSGDDHESQAEGEEETLVAAEAGLRDRTHAG